MGRGFQDGLTDKVYFVHSFCALPTAANHEWVLTTTDYGSEDQTFISSVQKGNVMATQFHPEKNVFEQGVSLSEPSGQYVPFSHSSCLRPSGQ